MESKRIDEPFKNKEKKPDALIPALQDIQAAKGYVSEDSIAKIAEATKTTRSRVFGVATFYNRFQFEPVPRYLIRVCHGTACHVAGSEEITTAVTDTLRDSDKVDSHNYKVETVACLGCCSLAPCMMINEEVFAWLTGEKAQKIVQNLE